MFKTIFIAAMDVNGKACVEMDENTNLDNDQPTAEVENFWQRAKVLTAKSSEVTVVNDRQDESTVNDTSKS